MYNISVKQYNLLSVATSISISSIMFVATTATTTPRSVSTMTTP